MIPNKEIIIIDDSDYDTYIVKHILGLSEIKFCITTFNCAISALEVLKNRNDINVLKIILLDIRMPNMNGFQFLEAFALLPDKIKESFRIFMLSSSIDVNDHEEALTNPFVSGFFIKPFNSDYINQINHITASFKHFKP